MYRKIIDISMNTNCVPLVADSFLFCYERAFMLSVSDNRQADVVESFNSTSTYLNVMLNIDNHILNKYSSKLRLNKAYFY